jgi:hypothetical protein
MARRVVKFGFRFAAWETARFIRHSSKNLFVQQIALILAMLGTIDWGGNRAAEIGA